MHSRIGVCIGKFEEIITVKIWNLLAKPLVLNFVKIAVKI